MLTNQSVEAKSQAAKTVIFGDINSIAIVERARCFAEVSDPPEIQFLREQLTSESREFMARATTQANIDREIARTAGAKQGYVEGFKAGLSKVTLDLEQFKSQYSAEITVFLDLIAEDRRSMWLKMENQVGELVLEIVRKVIKDEAEINRDIAISTVRSALRRVVDSEQVRIRVNVADLDSVRAAKEDLLEIIQGTRNIEIISDRRVDPGGCIVESDSGVIDSNISSQLNAIEAEFNDRLPKDA